MVGGKGGDVWSRMAHFIIPPTLFIERRDLFIGYLFGHFPPFIKTKNGITFLLRTID